MASKREYRLDITFDGEIAEDVEQFWHHYELTARQNIAAKIWSDEDDAPKLLAIEKQLRGKAALFVRGLPEENKGTVTALHAALRRNMSTHVRFKVMRWHLVKPLNSHEKNWTTFFADYNVWFV